MSIKSICKSKLCNVAGHNENDLTRMFAIILNYNRPSLTKFLDNIGIPMKDRIDKVGITTQLRDISLTTDSKDEKRMLKGIYDIEIYLKDCFKVIIEAKLESRPDSLKQLKRYAENLKIQKESGIFPVVRLIFLTKYNEEKMFREFLVDNALTQEESIYLRWLKKVKNSPSILELMEQSLDSNNNDMNKDFLNYLKDLAPPNDDFYVGIIRNINEFNNLIKTLTYKYPPLTAKHRNHEFSGAEYFIPYKQKENFRDRPNGIDFGMDCYAKIDIGSQEIKLQALKSFPNGLHIELRGRGGGKSHFPTSLEILRKALYHGVDETHRLQKPEDWVDVEIPDNDEWRWLREWNPD